MTKRDAPACDPRLLPRTVVASQSGALCTLLSLLVLLGGCEPGPHVLYGFMDAQGVWVVPPEYDDAAPFSGGLSAVKKGGRWGFVDRQGQRVIEPAFDEALGFTEGLAAVRTDSGWKFIDAAGATVIPGPFEDALPFADGLAPVETDDKWGFIDRDGKWAIPARFEELRCRVEDPRLVMLSCFSEGLGAVRVGERWGYIDRQGRWAIEPRFENAMSFAEGLAAACEPDADDNCVFGYLDRRGGWAIAPRFVWAMHFSGGRAIALVERHGAPTAPDPAAAGEPPQTPQTAILIDADGKEIATLGWEPLLDVFAQAAWVIEALAPDYLAEGLVPATEGNRWGYRDRDGPWRIEPQYITALPFRRGVAVVGLSDDPEADFLNPDRWMLLDTQGRRIAAERLTMIGGGAGPLFPGQLYSRWGLLDRDGRWRVPPVYAEEEGWLDLPIFRLWPTEGLYRMGVHANHRWLVADARGRRLGVGEYQWISVVRNAEGDSAPRLAFLQNGLWGLATVRLKPLTPARYDRIVAGEAALLEVTLDGRVGCMDRRGRWVVPAEFDAIEMCGREPVRGRRGAEAGTWTRAGGWMPDPPSEEPAATDDAFSDSVWISNQVFWHKQGELYSLFRDSVRVTDVEPADQVRHVEMRFAGGRMPAQLAVVRRGTSWSVLDETGRPWLPLGYDGIGKMFDGLVAVQREGRWRIVDSKGREAFPGREEELQPFTPAVAIFCRDKRCGLLGRDGRILLPPNYRSITPLSRTQAKVAMQDPEPESHYDLVGIVDRTGRVIVEPVYRQVERFSDSLWNATDRLQETRLLSGATGKPVPGLDHLVAVANLSERLAAASFRLDGDAQKAGYIDEAGRIVIPPRFDADGSAAPFQNGAALVKIDGRCGAIDRRGRLLVPAEYDHCYRLADGGIVAGAEAGSPALEPFLQTAPAGLRRQATPAPQVVAPPHE